MDQEVPPNSARSSKTVQINKIQHILFYMKNVLYIICMFRKKIKIMLQDKKMIVIICKPIKLEVESPTKQNKCKE